MHPDISATGGRNAAGARITAMMTFAVVLMTLMVLGVATHFVPALRRGRVGYAPNLGSRRPAELRDLPPARESFEFALTPRREVKLVGCDQVCDGV